MMTRNVFAFAALAVALIAQGVVADDATIEDMAEDIVTVEVHLNVSYHADTRTLVGDPPARVPGSTQISFSRTGVYTMIKFKEGLGMDYMMVPGMVGGTEVGLTEAHGIRIRQSHTCVDDQPFAIGRQSADLSSSAEVHPASGGLTLTPAEGQADRVRIGLHSWKISTDYVDCPTPPQCFNYHFAFNGEIGDHEDAWVETPEGHLQGRGIELAVVDWSLIKSLAEGGELALVIPISAMLSEQEDDGHAITTELYTVSGVIAPFHELPLEPLVPAGE